ncbi:hypothetical protein JOM56_014978 [Amanita muscaria]
MFRQTLFAILSIHPPNAIPTLVQPSVTRSAGGLTRASPRSHPCSGSMVGKSVIAKTISGFHNQVVATFFFSTSYNRSATTLFPTLAWQLARRIPDTREHIIASLRNSGSLQATQIEEQFDLLILQPLRSITTLKYRPVMVIDGVDECIDESMLVRFLRVLVRAGEGGGMPVRFIICSRPEPRIRAILGRGHDVNRTVNGEEPQLPSMLHRFLHLAVVPELSRSKHLPHNPIKWFIIFLQDVIKLYRPIRIAVHKDAPSPSDELTAALDRICPHPVISTIKIGVSEESKQDIAIYLTDALNAIPQPGDGTRSWFQSYDISDLVEASCGQFLYASTIVRLLDEPHIDPRDVLEMARSGSLPTPDLNKLYKAILKRAEDTIRNQAQDGGPGYQTEWRRVMDSLKMLVFFAGNVHFFYHSPERSRLWRNSRNDRWYTSTDSPGTILRTECILPSFLVNLSLSRPNKPSMTGKFFDTVLHFLFKSLHHCPIFSPIPSSLLSSLGRILGSLKATSRVHYFPKYFSHFGLTC